MGLSVRGLSACGWAWREWKCVWWAPQPLSPSFSALLVSPSISTTFQQSLDQQRPFHPINAGRCQIIIKISTESRLKKKLIRHLKNVCFCSLFFFLLLDTNQTRRVLSVESRCPPGVSGGMTVGNGVQGGVYVCPKCVHDRSGMKGITCRTHYYSANLDRNPDYIWINV